MFGMGFMEILLIAIVAIIALGPEKLPDAMVQIAKFIRKFKSGLEDAKSTLDTELNVSDMKDQANKFKAQLDDLKTSVSNETKVDLGLNDIVKDTDNTSKEEKIEENDEKKVSFKKEKKKNNEDKKEENI